MLHFANPNVVVIQSRLFSAGYQGAGNWILFNTANRKSYSAIGSDIMTIMACASGGATREELLESAPSITPQQFDKLTACELVVEGDRMHQTRKRAFVDFYHNSVFDYPFRDYSDADWRIKDSQLMAQYASQWLPPPSVLEHEGKFYFLPDVLPESLLENEGNLDFTLVRLAAILRYTFGATAKKKTPHVECVRRTSPSGGSRHPTECVVLLPCHYGEIPKGSYFYDVGRHALVETPIGLDAISRMPCGSRLGLVIRSRVERAMWRYRDIRSLRPILLDAGHIIETLSLLFRKAGLFVSVSSQPLSFNQEIPNLEEPDLVTLFVSEHETIPCAKDLLLVPSSRRKASLSWFTNPSLYMTFRNGMIVSNIVWPECCAVPITLSDFQMLDYCLPFAGVDRITTMGEIAVAVSGSSYAQVEGLANSHALLEKSTADTFYNAVALWTRYDWYLSLLAHLEVLVERTTQPTIFGLITSTDFVTGVDSLFARTTTRKFANIEVPRLLAEHVLTKSFSCLRPMLEGSHLQVFVAALAINGLDEAIYEWDLTTATFTAPLRSISRDLVREMTIGQYPAGAGALTVWLVSRLDLTMPARYEMDIIEMGRIGQRLCLVATEAGLGIFLTPAVYDRKTFEMLGITDQTNAVIYLMSIGYAMQ